MFVIIEETMDSCVISEETIRYIWQSLGFMVICIISKKRPLSVYEGLWGSWSHVLYNRRDHLVFMTVYKVHGRMSFIKVVIIECLWQPMGFMVSYGIYHRRDHWVFMTVYGIPYMVIFIISYLLYYRRLSWVSMLDPRCLRYFFNHLWPKKYMSWRAECLRIIIF